MKKQTILLSTAVIFGAFSLTTLAAPPDKKTEDIVKAGQELTLKLCQTCHDYAGTEQAGTVGPPLVGMKARFPDRKKLYNIIYDPQVALKPHTMMPPFGRNELLAKDEIEKVIEFLYTL